MKMIICQIVTSVKMKIQTKLKFQVNSLYTFNSLNSNFHIYSLGGGKDLAAAASIVEARGNKVKQEPDIKPEPDLKMGQMPMGSYHPKMGGMHPSPYDMMRTPQCKYDHQFLIWYINR